MIIPMDAAIAPTAINQVPVCDDIFGAFFAE
jgi:hypothetical protein